MKMKRIVLLIILMALAFSCFTVCENPIINKWWGEDSVEQEPNYVALLKNIPIYDIIIEEKTIYEYIYKTIYEYINLPPEIKYEYILVEKPLPPEILLQHINVVNIEFIFFSGDQEEYNKDSPSGGTNLKPQERDLNDLNIKEMAVSLRENVNQLIILHGHANPTSNDPEELKELEEFSTNRAKEVARQIEIHSINEEIPDLEKRMTVRGYGGGKNISGSGSSYAGLNRRVEMILIEIETVPGSGSENTRGQ